MGCWTHFYDERLGSVFHVLLDRWAQQPCKRQEIRKLTKQKFIIQQEVNTTDYEKQRVKLQLHHSDPQSVALYSFLGNIFLFNKQSTTQVHQIHGPHFFFPFRYGT
jgi:hypothetical protein